jgi:hypothetical protein
MARIFITEILTAIPRNKLRGISNSIIIIVLTLVICNHTNDQSPGGGKGEKEICYEWSAKVLACQVDNLTLTLRLVDLNRE